MRTVQRIGILFLLLVFLCGTIGISIFEHICACRGTSEITLFPEIFNTQSSCCCSEGEAELVTPENAPFCSIENPTRCKNIKFFIKATITPAPVVVNLFSFLDFTAHEYQMLSDILPATDSITDNHFIHACNSPPISGRQRVIAYQQLRIPAPHLFLI
ncbi:MAG: hypothetical protein Q8M08_14895 [Bacteroidales bacterium]|nr:hypothetical protein [Bacteroidales bacterium]